MSKLGNCIPCGNPSLSTLSRYSPKLNKRTYGLGSCAPCNALLPMFGSANNSFGDWYVELKQHLQPMMPWILGVSIITGYIGFKLGKWHCFSIILEREAVAAKIPAKKKKK